MSNAPASEMLPNFIFHGYIIKAEAGDAAAQFSLGILHEKQIAPDASVLKAIEWYEKAASNGHAAAALRAAQLLLKNKSKSGFLERAYNILKIASDAGSLDATYNLAYMLETGAGTTKNIDQAIILYTRSADAGHIMSMRQIGMLHWQGRGAIKDDVAAKDWLMRAASLGDEAAALLIEKINKTVVE